MHRSLLHSKEQEKKTSDELNLTVSTKIDLSESEFPPEKQAAHSEEWSLFSTVDGTSEYFHEPQNALSLLCRQTAQFIAAVIHAPLDLIQVVRLDLIISVNRIRQ